MKNVSEQILLNAQQTPQAAAIEYRGTVRSYAELMEVAYQAANILDQLGLEQGDNLAVCLRESEESIILMVGAWLKGITVMMIDFRSQPDHVSTILAAYPAKLLIGTTPAAEGEATPFMAASDWQEQRTKADAAPVEPEQEPGPAFRTLTSGTSGTPAALDVSHLALLARRRSSTSVLPKNAYTRHLNASPMSFAGSQGWVTGALAAGGTVVLFPTVFRASDLASAFERLRIESASLVPAAYRDLLALHGENDGYLGVPGNPPLLVTGGAAMEAAELLEMRKRLSPHVWNWFAASPIGSIAYLDVAAHPDKVGAMGKPLNYVDVEIVDDHDAPVPTGQIGRMRVTGAGIADRILGRGKSSGADYIEDGWYYSGDLASFDEDGFLHFAGRGGDVINRAGVTIYPSEIETAMAQLPGVREVVAVGFADKRAGEEICAFVVAKSEVTSNDLEQHAKAMLTADKRPRRFELIDTLPLNHNGKVKRRLLVKQLEAALKAEDAEG